MDELKMIFCCYFYQIIHLYQQNIFLNIFYLVPFCTITFSENNDYYKLSFDINNESNVLFLSVE